MATEFLPLQASSNQARDFAHGKSYPITVYLLFSLRSSGADLVVALQNRNGPVSGWELMRIAAIQQAIQAFEDVIADLDAEMEEMEAAAPENLFGSD